MLGSIRSLKASMVVAQHMQSEMISLYAKDLGMSYPHLTFSTTPCTCDGFTPPKVVVCGEGACFEPVGNGVWRLTERRGAPARYCPDIDNLFLSAVPMCAERPVYAALLTGIGDDGATGLLALKEAGAITLAESSESAPVFGMPRAAIERGAAMRVLSVEEMVAFFEREGLVDV
jgi:two-component system chemotaxis response regulator CheB